MTQYADELFSQSLWMIGHIEWTDTISSSSRINNNYYLSAIIMFCAECDKICFHTYDAHASQNAIAATILRGTHPHIILIKFNWPVEWWKILFIFEYVIDVMDSRDFNDAENR